MTEHFPTKKNGDRAKEREERNKDNSTDGSRQVLRSSSVLLHEYGVKEENHLSASLSPIVLGIQKNLM